jgi:chromosome segregation ATPase
VTNFKNELESLNQQSQQDRSELKQFDETKALLQEAQEEMSRLHKENSALQSQLIQMESQQQEATESSAAPTGGDASSVEMPVNATENEIPRYNLSEHRRSTASRRKRIEPAAPKTRDRSVENVIKQYVGESVRAGEVKAERTSLCHDLWDDDSLTLFQKELLQEIIQRDISEYCKN